MRHALGMARRIGDRLRAALRKAEQDEPVEFGGVDHRFQVLHQPVEGDVDAVALRHADATGVVAQHGMVMGERQNRVPHDRTVEVVLEVGEPVRRPHQFGPWPIMA